MAGQVRVEGMARIKSGNTVPRSAQIEILSPQKYVSRGGLKLEGALEDFNLDPGGLICLDVGSSTGGFTDCLLQKGARLVYAVDVGKAQLDIKIKSHPKVHSFEGIHILRVTSKEIEKAPELAVVDVSFISLKKVLPHILQLMGPKATLVAMVKPQFEVGPKNLKKGVVRSEEIQKRAVEAVAQFAKEKSCDVLGQTPARIKGPKGNQEYFLYLRKQ